MTPRNELSDNQWTHIESFIPKQKVRADGKGRPRRSNREIVNGILWILRTGARWQDMPEEFPPYQTCHRRLQEWVCSGRLRHILEALAKDFEDRGKFNLNECFIDVSRLCREAKKGAPVSEKPSGARGTKLMAVADSSGIPIAVHIASAAPHEVTLVRETLKSRFLQSRPQRLIGDRAYDSDALDYELQQNDIEVISPHKVNRVKPKTQDGRPLRRYAKRWRIERLFAWLHNFRRLVVRYEYHAENFLGFVHLACIIILLRKGF